MQRKAPAFGIGSMRISQNYREGCEHQISLMRAVSGKSGRIRLWMSKGRNIIEAHRQ